MYFFSFIVTFKQEWTTSQGLCILFWRWGSRAIQLCYFICNCSLSNMPKIDQNSRAFHLYMYYFWKLCHEISKLACLSPFCRLAPRWRKGPSISFPFNCGLTSFVSNAKDERFASFAIGQKPKHHFYFFFSFCQQAKNPRAIFHLQLWNINFLSSSFESQRVVACHVPFF